MTKFEKWCYDHSCEVVIDVASMKCPHEIVDVELYFHFLAASDGFSGEKYRQAITKMLTTTISLLVTKPNDIKTMGQLRLRIAKGAKICQS